MYVLTAFYCGCAVDVAVPLAACYGVLCCCRWSLQGLQPSCGAQLCGPTVSSSQHVQVLGDMSRQQTRQAIRQPDPAAQCRAAFECKPVASTCPQYNRPGGSTCPQPQLYSMLLSRPLPLLPLSGLGMHCADWLRETRLQLCMVPSHIASHCWLLIQACFEVHIQCDKGRCRNAPHTGVDARRMQFLHASGLWRFCDIVTMPQQSRPSQAHLAVLDHDVCSHNAHSKVEDGTVHGQQTRRPLVWGQQHTCTWAAPCGTDPWCARDASAKWVQAAQSGFKRHRPTSYAHMARTTPTHCAAVTPCISGLISALQVSAKPAAQSACWATLHAQLVPARATPQAHHCACQQHHWHYPRQHNHPPQQLRQPLLLLLLLLHRTSPLLPVALRTTACAELQG